MKTLSSNLRIETNPIRALAHSNGFILGFMLAAHPVLAMLMKSSALAATAHALLVLSLGVWWAIFAKDLRRAGYVAAYITGAEVLWRMTDARIFWEGGKYFTILILGLVLLRIRPWRRPALPIVFFLLLCISIPLTYLGMDPGSARGAISFNLSGPLALSVCVLYFSQIELDRASLRSLLWALVFPILGIATLTLSSTLSGGQIRFTQESNLVTSGGFGPNQVSAMLGLGAGLLLLMTITGKRSFQGLITLGLGMGLISLSALTFSRGGLYNAGAMVALALVHFLQSGRGRTAALATLLAVGIAGGYLIFPSLNSFTGGMLQQRFLDMNLSHRGEIAQADLALWAANPFFGIGPGMSTSVHANFVGIQVAPHTEYTRILAEHGSTGLLALLLMLLMATRGYFRTPSAEARMWAAAFVGWSLMEMSHAAMRIVAISFMFGLAMMGWAEPANEPSSKRRAAGK